MFTIQSSDHTEHKHRAWASGRGRRDSMEFRKGAQGDWEVFEQADGREGVSRAFVVGRAQRWPVTA